MKIIDFKIKGNQIKFFLGRDGCTEYKGDDWDNYPYEDDAGPVYDVYITGYFVKTFDFDDIVVEPSDCDWDRDSRCCKNDMKERKIPCVCVLPEKYKDECASDTFLSVMGCEHSIKYFFGDIIDETKENIVYINNNTDEHLYFKISDDIGNKITRISIHMFSEFLKYGKQTDSKYFFDLDIQKNIKNYTIENYEEVYRNIVKLVSKFYKIKCPLNKIKEIKLEEIKYNNINRSEEKYYYICYDSTETTEIGEIIYK